MTTSAMKPKTPDEPRTEEIIKASSIPLQGGRGVAAAASCKNDVCVLVVDATGPYSVVKAVITSESNDGECCEVQLGCATSWAVCWRGDGLAAAVALTDDGAAEGEPRHRCVFVAKSGGGYFCVDTKAVECAAGGAASASSARRSPTTGPGVAFDDGTLRVATYKVDHGRVVEALSCACDAEGGEATALAVCGGDRFVVGYGDGGCAVFRAEFCDVMETAAVTKLMDLPPLAGAGAVTALAGCAHWLFARISEAFDAVDLREDDEAALANALHALAGGGPAAIPAAAVVAKVFAEATCGDEDVVAAAGVVCGWPFGSDAGAEAALRAALRGLGLRDGGSRDARRALEAALERLDVFRELLASMDARPHAVGALASGTRGDVWLADLDRVVATDDEQPNRPRDELRALYGTLRHVLSLRDDHGVASTLDSYESADKSAIARALLDRVEDPAELGTEIDAHVRPICGEHGVDCDALLLDYARACARAFAVARATEKKRRSGGRGDAADATDARLARALAVREEIVDDAKRQLGALEVLERARPPYGAAVVALATDVGDDDGGDEDRRPAERDVATRLRDAARLNLSCPEFGDADLGDLDGLADSAALQARAMGSERQSARREVLAYFAATLDDAEAPRSERRCCAVLGARLARTPPPTTTALARTARSARATSRSSASSRASCGSRATGALGRVAGDARDDARDRLLAAAAPVLAADLGRRRWRTSAASRRSARPRAGPTPRPSRPTATPSARGRVRYELARHLAEVGEALAARLEDGHLEHASRSLAVDARWWKFLRERGVRFDHARLCLQAPRRRRRRRDTEAVARARDGAAAGRARRRRRRALDGETIGAVLELCGRYGVADDAAGSAIATRARAASPAASLDVAAREALDLVRDDDARRRVLRAALATADGAAYDRVDLALRLLLEAGDDDEAEATLLASCVHAAPRDAAAPPLAAPPRATLTKWRRCAAWLKAVEDDARTQLGARGAAALGDRKLSFHDVVARPREALSDLLSEASCPHLSVVCGMVDGLPPGSLWVALADKAAKKPRPGSKEEAFFYRCLDRAGNAALAFRRSAELADAFAADLAAAPSAAAGLGELRATREAAKHASAWADGAREPAAPRR
ncbi:hypothetical protein JL720_1361 [Aureococcus anophagefferens]|nr:hypothetical protein JL720_1361 [Aureococcus anophagefferens]